MDKNKILIIIGAVVLILVVWGLIGGVITGDIGMTCNLGSDGNICWLWEKNALGELGDVVNKIFN